MTKAMGGQSEVQKRNTGILPLHSVQGQNDKQKSKDNDGDSGRKAVQNDEKKQVQMQIPYGNDNALRAVLDASRKEDAQPKGERLQKILAAAGVASRRKAEEIILAGRVQVNGKVVAELGTKHDAARDHIRVDGKLLKGPEKQRYYMLNKPRGYVTTLDDPQKRATVMDLMGRDSKYGTKAGPHGDRVRLYPVGRLDYLSEGLLLMTNDGELANSLSKAATGVEKTYLVKVSGVPTAAGLEQIRRGIVIDRGRLDEVRAGRRDRIVTAPARVELVRGGDNPWYEVTLTEGRNRQLRKMFEEIGNHVEKIRRIGYGALRLDVPPGEFRELKPGEVMALERAAAGKKVVPKKRVPEFAQLKVPGVKKRR